MRIIHKLILGYLVVILLICATGYLAINTSQRVLRKSIGEYSILLARETIDKVDRDIFHRIEEIQAYSKDFILQRSVAESNQEFEKLDNIHDYIQEKDSEWVSAPEGELTPFMQKITNNTLAEELKAKKEFYKKEYGHLVFAELYTTNKYGVVIATTGRTPNYLQADEEWYQKTVKEKAFWISDVEYNESSGIYAMDIVVNLYDDDGDFNGILKSVLNIEETINIIEEIAVESEYKTTELKLLTKDGELIYSTEEEKYKILSMPYELFSQFERKEHVKYFIAEGDKPDEGEELFAHAHSNGYKTYEGLGWILVMEYETEEIFMPITDLRNEILIILTMATLLAIVLGLRISTSISNPITKLRTAIIEIGKGKLDIKIDVKPKDEIGELATSFKKMTEDLKETTTSMANLNKEIDERKKAEERIKQVLEQWSKTFDTISDFVFIQDKNFKFVRVNKTFCDVLKTKPEDLIGKRCYEVLHKSDKPWPNCPFKKTLKDKRAHTEEIYDPNIGIVLLVSTSPLFDESGELTGAVHIAKDITERKKAEEELKKAYNELKETHAQLIQSEKLAAIGQLATGTAHEINNPLAVISGEAQMLFRVKDKDKNTKDASKAIIEQTKRIKLIIDRLLEFSCKREVKLEPLDVNDAVEKSLFLLSYQAKIENIEIVKELNPNLPKSFGDNSQIQEVFLNIMLNAIQAMEEGGRLTIRTRSEEITEYRRRKTDIFKKGQEAVIIEFKDTGKGMDDEALKKVFDPFFTTKTKNTGLGLSISYGIIKNHKGIIEAHSKLGEGSIFIVKLPIKGGGVG